MQASQGPAGPLLSSGDPLPAYRLLRHTGPVVSPRDALPPACCLLHRAQKDLCYVLGNHTCCLPLLWDSQDLRYHLGLPASCCLGTRRTFAVVSGHTAPCRLPETLGTYDVILGTLTPGYCSGTRRFCAVHSGLIAPFLPLVRDPQTCAVIYAKTAPCRLLRDQEVLWCSLGTQYPIATSAQGSPEPVLSSMDNLSVTAQGPTGLVISSQDPPLLPTAGRVMSSEDPLPLADCSGTCRSCLAVSGPTAPCLPCSGSHRTCAVLLGPSAP